MLTTWQRTIGGFTSGYGSVKPSAHGLLQARDVLRNCLEFKVIYILQSVELSPSKLRLCGGSHSIQLRTDAKGQS